MEEGKLYCEHCGEDIHIVPDFDNNLEENIASTVQDIATLFPEEEKGNEDALDPLAGTQVILKEPIPLRDTQSLDSLVLAREKRMFIMQLVAIVLLFLTLVILGVILFITLKRESAEQPGSATLTNDLSAAEDSDRIEEVYAETEAVIFSTEPGYYETITPLQLSSSAGVIYYTTDGSMPTLESDIYSMPILLEEGEYIISAMVCYEDGTCSEVVTNTYYVAAQALSVPVADCDSDTYTRPFAITITNDDVDVYYTINGAEPTESSTAYTGPIWVPLGKTTYKFIRIRDGQVSEVAEYTYELVLDTELTPALAVEFLVKTLYENGYLLGWNGSFDETDAYYEYMYQGIVQIADADYFIVYERLVDGEKVYWTGSKFAVEAYTGQIKRLAVDDENNMSVYTYE